MSLSKRLEEARQAFIKGDIEASAKAHTQKQITDSAKEKHGGASSQYLGNIVYGGLDGIITTFAVVSGVAGANLDTSIILIMGLANLFGDGFSMATGAFLSAKSDKEFYDRERAREAWEVEHFPDGEANELIEIYKQQGYPEEDALTMVAIKKKDSKRWVDAMMVEELGLMKDERKPISEAITTFIAFSIAGVVPLLYYLVDLVFHFNFSSQTAFFISMGLSGLALFGLGAAKVLVTERNAIKSGFEMLVVGGAAAAVAYIVGALLKGFGG
ncbi:MAG TPA: VIT1/CCC1 transporter family protein [Longilinea sp.]|nr:VIT1/CCC1 transporter family protein [Longilinea sp.]